MPEQKRPKASFFRPQLGTSHFSVGGMPTQEVLASVERASFDGSSLGAWEPAGDLPEPRTHLAAFAHNSAIFVVGGGSALPAG